MLVLSRKIGERIYIGAGIEIAIVAVRGRQVRIGVDAPDDVPIRRVASGPASRDEDQAAAISSGRNRE